MGIALVPIIKEMFDKSLSFADNVMKNFDDKKFAESVTEMYGKEPTYEELDAAIEIIKQDTTMSSKEKVDLLMVLSKQREEARARYMDKQVDVKKKHAETLSEATQKKGDIAVKVAMGVLTGGLSLIPDAVKGIQNASDKKKDKKDDDHLIIEE